MTDAGDIDGLPARGRRALGTLQDAFRTAYRRHTEQTIAALRRGDPPVVIRASDAELLLLGPAGTERFDLDVDAYDRLKELSHIAPLAMLLVEQAAASDPGRDPLERGTIEAALAELGTVLRGREGAAIVAATRDLLRALDATATPPDALLERYRDAVTRALEDAARAAARADLAALARAMRTIETRIPKRDLQQAYYVVCGGHQSRRHELTRQFFRRWLDRGGAQAAHHVLYAENRSTLDEVLELVAARIVDERIAERLFDDATRLDEDVLGQAAEELLDATPSIREFGTGSEAGLPGGRET